MAMIKFDHILAAVPQFELRVIQEPAGKDFEKLAHLKSH